MKKKVSGRYSYMISLIIHFLVKDKAVLLGILTTVFFIMLSSKFHFEFQKSLTKIEQYIARKTIDETDSSRLLITFMLLPISHYMSSLLYKLVSAYVIQLLIGKSFHHCLREYLLTNYHRFHHLGSGQIHSLVERRSNGMVSFLRILFADIFFNASYVLWGFLYFSRCSTGVVILTVIQILVYVVVSWYGTILRNHFRRKYNGAYNFASNRLYGILQNYDIIKSYNKEENELQKYIDTFRDVGRHSRRYDQINGFVEFFQKSLLFVPNAFMVLMIIGGYMFKSMRIGNRYIEYSKFFSELRSGIMKLKESTFVMNENLTDIFDSKIEDALEEEDLGLAIERFGDTIRFNGMSVHIGNRLILEGFSGEIKKGEKIGIIGKNGCGKSSLVNVLLRFLDYSGEVYIDGIELRRIRKSSVRGLISFVPQNHHLFNGTILENIGYSYNSIEYDHVMKKCVHFNVHEIFSKLPRGYQTLVGENGKFLSGGQKQRVSFMRAMVKDSDIVVLDEPTSNLDADSEKELVETILKKMEDKTVFLVVHDHDLLRGFDKILGLHDNKVKIYNSFDDFIIDKSKY
ncbi:MdlB-type mitochondrial ABC transporter [Encephalitozoon intestinalis ATCC 50506]|uniref:MdlB-type mitochondrial ABC transporter n=1 Tax=Encephalitozoon intestinalis (strain ATCC 50506) TaxID=876142 RepID=E0S9Q8_ENCIT|nr:MdlB-type mitochondrial ABC transporter [Encephalitozoon intestinalis ATCC 50506]ADM12443.1 MdlB-type mitochondrial ABC transporter [Encephalitozoon intestinalis ATCC 50506]UTX46279.1 ABC transporter [Encephalitozoon intestinalis]